MPQPGISPKSAVVLSTAPFGYPPADAALKAGWKDQAAPETALEFTSGAVLSGIWALRVSFCTS